MENFYSVEVYDAKSNQWGIYSRNKYLESAMKIADYAHNDVGTAFGGGKKVVRISLNGEIIYDTLSEV
jgi:hypothetical protein